MEENFRRTSSSGGGGLQRLFLGQPILENFHTGGGFEFAKRPAMRMRKWKTAAGVGAILGFCNLFCILLALIPIAHSEPQELPPGGPNVFVELSKKVVPSVVN